MACVDVTCVDGTPPSPQTHLLKLSAETVQHLLWYLAEPDIAVLDSAIPGLLNAERHLPVFASSCKCAGLVACPLMMILPALPFSTHLRRLVAAHSTTRRCLECWDGPTEIIYFGGDFKLVKYLDVELPPLYDCPVRSLADRDARECCKDGCHNPAKLALYLD